MAISVTHTGSNSGASATSLTISFSTVAAGAELRLALTESDNFQRTYTVSDDVNGSWTQVLRHVAAGNTRLVEIWKYNNSASGSPLITVTPSAAANLCIGAVAATGMATTEDDSSTYDNPNSNPMYAAAATGFDPSAGALILGAIAPNASITGSTFDANYTVLIDRPATNPLGAIGYRVVGGSPLTNERMSWQGVSTVRVGPGASASWGEAAGPAAQDFPFRRYYMGR